MTQSGFIWSCVYVYIVHDFVRMLKTKYNDLPLISDYD